MLQLEAIAVASRLRRLGEHDTAELVERWAQSSDLPNQVRRSDELQRRSFWARMQVELLNRKRWNARLELANAIFEYLEIFHNRQRRHSSLGMLTPIEYELRHADRTACDQAS